MAGNKIDDKEIEQKEGANKSARNLFPGVLKETATSYWACDMPTRPC